MKRSHLSTQRQVELTAILVQAKQAWPCTNGTLEWLSIACLIKPTTPVHDRARREGDLGEDVQPDHQNTEGLERDQRMVAVDGSIGRAICRMKAPSTKLRAGIWGKLEIMRPAFWTSIFFGAALVILLTQVLHAVLMKVVEDSCP